ncbi:pathogenicity island protein [Staphylococcus succinus]|uniref:pathogenicity island protein n=1 Tax=Staphylococcus succinus TaxID=61015 RepID=UPI000AC2ED3C|nr:pathogenicity island protein [Staphylococcus succinus]MBU0439055.1 pathogenicity island protein [Staphylococcus succinus]
MKTEHLFDEYNEFLDNQQSQLKNLKAEANELNNSIKADEEQYKEHISTGEDKKADKLYHSIEESKKSLSALNKRIATKADVYDELKLKKTIELLKNQKELPNLYHSDRLALIEQLQPVIEQYNAIINSIIEVNNEYLDEFQDFVDLYESENISENKEARAELRGYFRYQTGGLIPNTELPFINQMDKKIRKGVK